MPVAAAGFVAALIVGGAATGALLTSDSTGAAAAAASLEFAKTAPESARVGDTIVYDLVVRNTSSDEAVDVTLGDELPSQVKFDSADDRCTYDAELHAVSCALPIVAGEATEEVFVRVTALEPGVVENTATLREGDSEPLTSSATTTVTDGEPVTDLTITKSAPASATVLDNFTYTLEVDNVGETDVTEVVVTDPLPAGVEFVSSEDDCDESEGVVTCAIGTLAADNGATVSFDVMATSTGSKVNTATVAGAEEENGEAPNSDSATTTVGSGEVEAGRVISNGTVRLGVVNLGNVNFGGYGVNYVPTGNDGTRAGCSCEGWGAGANGPTRFQGRANNSAGINGVSLVSFASTATTATSVVDVLRGGTPGLRVTHEFVPSPQTPNLYQITIRLKNLTDGALTDVRYTREMDWDAEPTAFSEYVTINRGAPPASLVYSDDNGFADNYPFTDSGPLDPATVNTSYVDKGPADHGARFIFTVGGLAPGEEKTLTLFYGAAGSAAAANAAISGAALEVYSLAKPSSTGGLSSGVPNTFIWGFRGVGGTAVIPPSLTISPTSLPTTASSGPRTLTVTVVDSAGNPVPNAPIVFVVTGANPQPPTAATTGEDGKATFTYTPENDGVDTVTACLDSDGDGTCGTSEVTARAFGGGPPGGGGGGGGGGTPNGGGGTTTTTTTTTTTPAEPPLPPPSAPNEFSARVVSGTVLVNGVPVTGDVTLRDGDVVDATNGVIRIRSVDGDAIFYGGAFRIRRIGDLTVLELVGGDFGICSAARNAQASQNTPVRRLWGKGSGRFQTKARFSSATVRGTTWLTEDQCEGSLTHTEEGLVQVYDFSLRRFLLVSAGGEYLAKQPPPPTPGRFVGRPSGIVLVNGGPITQATQIRNGDRVNVLRGRIQLATTGGTATFYGGIFVVNQGATRASVTVLRLDGGNFRSCTTRALAGSSADKPKSKKTVRSLWGSGKGRFQTKARFTSATVRGTIWLTSDRCDGSLVRVRQGVVEVRDLVKQRTVLVRAGKQYLAQAPR